MLCQVVGKHVKGMQAKRDRILISVGDINELVKLYDDLSMPKGAYTDFVTDLLNTDINLSGKHDDAIDSISGLSQMKSGRSNSVCVEAW